MPIPSFGLARTLVGRLRNIGWPGFLGCDPAVKKISCRAIIPRASASTSTTLYWRLAAKPLTTQLYFGSIRALGD